MLRHADLREYWRLRDVPILFEPYKKPIQSITDVLSQKSDVVLLGGGPGKLKDDKTSYWHRLLSAPTQYKLEALDPEIAQAIEIQAVAAIEQPKIDLQAEMQRAMENMGIAYKQAYQEIYSELIAEMRQAQEDEQIATIMALML